jgi:hypothetical protein
MFAECTNLKFVKAMFILDLYDISSHYMERWLTKVSEEGMFIMNADFTGPIGRSGSFIPKGWQIIKG